MTYPLCPPGYDLVEFPSTVQIWRKQTPGFYATKVAEMPKPYDQQSREWWQQQIQEAINKAKP